MSLDRRFGQVDRRETRQSSLRLSLAGSSGGGKAQVAVIRRINQENLMLELSGSTQEHEIGFSETRNCYPETEGWLSHLGCVSTFNIYKSVESVSS